MIYEQLISLMNLGYIHAVQCGWKPPLVPLMHTKESMPNLRKDFVVLNCIETALAHWHEALEELMVAVREEAGVTSATSTATAAAQVIWQAMVRVISIVLVSIGEFCRVIGMKWLHSS